MLVSEKKVIETEGARDNKKNEEKMIETKRSREMKKK
jgi:hypothetical protein